MSKELKEKLFKKKQCGWELLETEEQKEAVFDISQQYMDFINTSKTEREFMTNAKKEAIKQGFKPIEEADPEKDNKLFLSYDNVCGALVYIKHHEFEKGFNLVAGHVDAPRLDLKQNPLYQDSGLGLFKTHYYGGIKKYQWVTIPLALHGVVINKKEEAINVVIGEDENDPVFTILDLLPHLGRSQMDKKASTVIGAEDLNLVIGSIPFQFKNESDSIKLNMMNILNEKYGIVEEDFVCANLQVVPAGKARHVGLDRSLVGAAGQDDRSCSYLGMKALFDLVNKNEELISENLMMMFVDKEEIGSVGNSGTNSNLIQRIYNDVLNFYGVNDFKILAKSLRNSKGLSSDVNAGVNPSWKGVHDLKNASPIGYGIGCLTYTGARGKSGTSQSHPEFTRKIVNALKKDNVAHTFVNLGAVDVGGGGTIAKFMAYWGMQVIDCGVPVLAMHSPFEITSKVDLYMTYLAYKAFFKYL
ncbi:m18 family aminopeptidase 1-related [Anaeramoeba flamelloides]|uniref:M18 family aminopeptidase 1-related n=1 Tax=Anaeramoeba flamelloides TaxID=1746091 RepID=A0AAV8A7J6_9EUKA|nr:m18 family aminopeptidase 1-related [Anaeramoeba flamelloides]KAJ6246214.1 m18 family aminopeptidase 1-related [Anaeramoeba flamelloides]|eukprot:Anaeramoba_flamelloidesa572311_926.p1 GENE.a572311_926~~a572311_926.p1  ORF type:complete len:472 (-),score=129.34 a572311_926:239-1654(-)